MFSWIFVAKKKKKRTESLVLYLVEICKDFPIFLSLLIKITETRFDSEPRGGGVCTQATRLFLLSKHFLRSLRSTRAREQI